MFTLGLDLGQAANPTGLVALQRTEASGDKKHSYTVRAIVRVPLGTPYVGTKDRPGIVEIVGGYLQAPGLKGCALAIDRTGVGRAEVDAFRAGKLACIPWGVTITAGQEVRQEGLDLWVPKRDLVGVVRYFLDGGRLAIPPYEMSPVLLQELRNFRVKITTSANETFGAWREGAHDDMVLALALALWIAERFPPYRIERSTAPRSPFWQPRW